MSPLMEEHLTVEDLATWSPPPEPDKLRYAFHLSTGCDTCWSAIAAVEAVEPRRQGDPFLRAVARVRHPKVDLTLPSQAIRPLIHPKLSPMGAWGEFIPDDFPSLLLQESVALNLESGESGRAEEHFDLPSTLAKLLMSETGQARRVGIDLHVNVGCAAVEYHCANGEPEKAESSFSSAREHFQPSCEPSTEVNLMLALLKVACLKAREGNREEKTAALAKVRDVSDRFELLKSDPVRRFEIVCDVTRTVQWVAPAAYEDRASWALSELGQGPWVNEIHRLNGLFHRARFAAGAGSAVPEVPLSAASELESELKSLYKYGGYFSLARCHELRGRLRRTRPISSRLSRSTNLWSWNLTFSRHGKSSTRSIGSLGAGFQTKPIKPLVRKPLIEWRGKCQRFPIRQMRERYWCNVSTRVCFSGPVPKQSFYQSSQAPRPDGSSRAGRAVRRAPIRAHEDTARVGSHMVYPRSGLLDPMG